MKRWPPIAYPGPGDTHRNANPAAGIRGSWPDGDGYQQIIDEICGVILKSGLALQAADSAQLIKAIRSQKLNYAQAGGTANAITITIDPEPSALADLLGVPLRIKTGSTPNSAATTLSVNGLVATDVKGADGLDLLAGELPAGTIFEVAYNGLFFQIINRPVPSAQRTPSAFAMITNATQAIAASTTTAVANFTPTFGDTLDSILAPDRITIGAKDAGWWVIGGKLMYEFPVSGPMYTNITIERNGIEIGGGNAPGTTTIRARPQSFAVYKLVSGDVIRLTTSTDTARSLVSGSSIFSGFKVGA